MLKLKAKFVEKGFSVADISNAIGVNTKTLYNKLKGTSYFNAKEMRALSILLDLDADDIAEMFLKEE